MNKVNVIFSLAFLFFVAMTTCRPKEKDAKSEGTESMDSTSYEQMAKIQYTCTMHPEVVTDAPGKCSKCGMELVRKESSGMENMHHDSTKHD